jgi:hypothetical protein
MAMKASLPMGLQADQRCSWGDSLVRVAKLPSGSLRQTLYVSRCGTPTHSLSVQSS